MSADEWDQLNHKYSADEVLQVVYLLKFREKIEINSFQVAVLIFCGN